MNNSNITLPLKILCNRERRRRSDGFFEEVEIIKFHKLSEWINYNTDIREAYINNHNFYEIMNFIDRGFTIPELLEYIKQLCISLDETREYTLRLAMENPLSSIKMTQK